MFPAIQNPANPTALKTHAGLALVEPSRFMSLDERTLQVVAMRSRGVGSIDERYGHTTVTVCAFRDRLLVEDRENPRRYNVGMDDDMAFTPIQLVYVREGQQPTNGEPGPATRANTSNVFGQWKIASMNYSMRDLGEHIRRQALEQCQASRGDIPRVPDEGKTVPKNDPSASIPPSPGWSNAPAV